MLWLSPVRHGMLGFVTTILLLSGCSSRPSESPDAMTANREDHVKDVTGHEKEEDNEIATVSERVADTERKKPTESSNLAARPDIQLLQGTWRVVTREQRGRQFTVNDWGVTFDGNHYAWVSPFPEQDASLLLEGTFSIDPTKTPKQINFVDHKMYGIYELSGDTLRFCSMNTGEDRPSEFKGINNATYDVLQRFESKGR